MSARDKITKIYSGIPRSNRMAGQPPIRDDDQDVVEIEFYQDSCFWGFIAILLVIGIPLLFAFVAVTRWLFNAAFG